MPNFRNPYNVEHHFIPYFVLVANDKELLNLINKQFKRRGYLALALDERRIEYYIDCRESKLNANSKILHVLGQNSYKLAEHSDNYDTLCRKKALFVQCIFELYDVDTALSGASMLRYIIDHADLKLSLLKPLSRKIYPQVAKVFNCSQKQVNRAINYALRKSKFVGHTLDFILFVSNTVEFMLNANYSLEDLQKMQPADLSLLAQAA